MLRRLWRQNFSEGYVSSNPRDAQGNYMSHGSQNLLVYGNGRVKVYRDTSTRVGTGSRVAMNVGDDYCGLGAKADSEGVGSVFRVLGAIFFIGAGSLIRNGTDTTADASTTLQIKKVESAALGTTYQAGLAQPSAPTIRAVTAPTGYSGKNNGVVSVKLARVRGATGARSNASPTSNVVTATNQSIAVTFPSADANGQDYWEVDVTKNSEGAVGNHFFLQEIPESVIAETITASATTDADTTITVPNDTLTSEHIGWQYTSSGDTTTYVTGVGADDSGGAGLQEITLAAASILSTTQSATFTRAVDGVTRTYVFEWQDADIIGSDLAPIRDYPPPAGIFGGVLGDVVFVDGALGDTVDVTQYAIDAGSSRANTSTTYRGNAIAISDPARPESFPPDNYIFTNDPPTALLPGGAGMYWRFSKNSLGVIRYIGGSPAVTYERLWTGVGIQKQHNAVLGAGGRLYAYTGSRGLVRLGVDGEPDTVFANRVSDDMADFTAANVVLGYDANHQYLLVMHDDTILAYHEGMDIWCAPCSFTSGSIRSCVTVDGGAVIGYDTGATLDLNNFNLGGSRADGLAYTPWIMSEGASDVVSRIDSIVHSDGDGEIVITVQQNGVETAVYTSATLSAGGAGFGHTATVKPNVRGCKSFRVGLALNVGGGFGIGDLGPETIRVEGVTSGIVV